MSFISPLSPKQKIVWSLLNSGASTSEVAEKLESSVQYVYQTKRAAEAKLLRALVEVAKASNIQMKGVLPEEGVLWGYNPSIRQNAIVTYTTKHGIKVWYWYSNPEEITDEGFLNETRSYLLDLAKERRLQLTEKEKKLHPSKLANLIFNRLIPGVKP